jgi:hypothetical protein
VKSGQDSILVAFRLPREQRDAIRTLARSGCRTFSEELRLAREKHTADHIRRSQAVVGLLSGKK